MFPCLTSPPGGTHISQVEGDLQVVPEHVREVGIHVQHLQQVVPQDLVEVAVGQSPDVGARFARPSVQADVLAENVVLSCRKQQEKTNSEREDDTSTDIRAKKGLLKKAGKEMTYAVGSD